MGKFYGVIGFSEPTEIQPGVWDDVITEKNFRGDVSKLYRRNTFSSESVNKDITVSNTISIIADPFIQGKIYAIKYIRWLGSYWEIDSVENQYPRIVLTLGGLYHGPVASASGDIEEHPKIE